MNLDNSDFLSSHFYALETSAASLNAAASATSLASPTSEALFPQRTSWSWWSEHWSCLVKWITKNTIFHWNLVPFCQRLLRPAYVTFLKTGWQNSNAPYSGIYRYFHLNLKVVFSWPQRSLLLIKSRYTLYSVHIS